MRNVVLIETIILLALSAVFLAMTIQFEGALSYASEGVQPSTVPRIALGAIIVAALLQAGFLWLRQPRAAGGSEKAEALDARPILVTIFVCAAYITAAYWLGFFVPMPFFCIALAALWGGRPMLKLVIYGIGCTVANWILFVTLFESDLPLGILGN